VITTESRKSVHNVTLSIDVASGLMENATWRAIARGNMKGNFSDIVEEAVRMYLKGMVRCTKCGFPFYSPPDSLIDSCPNCKHINHIKRSDI